MFTIVIPTMWKPNTLEELLISLCKSEYIDEIIIINNDTLLTPSFPILNDKKILKVNPLDNLVVNPSWNLGVRLSLNNNICLLNDDLLFDIDIFKFMSNHKDKNLCGISMFSKSEDFELEEADIRILGFGCMMFVKKDSYNFIPDNIIMFCGDDYLFYVNKNNGNKNYYINGCKNNQVYGTTSEPGIYCNEYKKNIIENEKTAIKEIFDEKGIIFHSR